MGTGFKRLNESNIFGTPKEEQSIKKTAVAVLGAVEQSYGIYQVPSFRDLVTTLWNDPLYTKSALLYAQQIVARGIFYTGNSNYKLILNGKTALDIIKEWSDKNNVDIKVFDIALELYAFGNSFWRITSDLGFIKIPVESVWHGVRVSPEIPLQEKYNIQLTPIYGGRIIPWEQFAHFRVFTIGYKAPFGRGHMQELLANPIDSIGVTAPSVNDIRLSMRTSLHEGFRKFSFGNELWVFDGMSNEDFTAKDEGGKTLGERIASMNPTGNRVATNAKGDIKLAVPERTQSYDSFIKQMRDEVHMALGEPSLKLGLEEGFTKATSITAREMHEVELSYYRSNIKQVFGDLFKQILNTMGYEGGKADIQMNFGIEEIAAYEVKDILAAVTSKPPIITPNEARTLLSKYHKWEIEGNIKGGDKTQEKKKTSPTNNDKGNDE